jgi:predicted metalloprotease with PDZ domain
MKQNLWTAILFGTMLSATAVAQDLTKPYNYTVDLTAAKNDQLLVELDVPDLAKAPKNIKFFIPKIVPGTYAVYNYGKFVEGFKAFDKKGKELKVSHTDPNTWEIKKSSKIAKISYLVNDSWDADAEKQKPLPFEPAGSNIEADKNFVINTHCFFGYFEGMTKRPYTVKFKHQPNFFGATALQRKQTDKETDTYVANNYNDLADGPIMYNKADTAMLKVGNAEVLISVYSPTGKVKAAFVKDQIQPTLNAQMQYLGGKLPVDRYAFIIYLTDGATGTGSYGALEHSYCSFYVLPEMEPERIAQTVRDVAAHEFFHIVTPLNIHSEEIQDFDFINPKMSQHLWLYEGTTEYKASHVQVMYGMMPLPKYVEVLNDKIIESLTAKTQDGALKYDDALSFTVMSKDVLGKYKEQYNNVYAKGTLIGLCLDIALNKNSNGKYNLNKLMDDLAKEYGKDKAFKDEDLFSKIYQVSKQPELKDFFEKYVIGTTPLPLESTLRQVGIDYSRSKMVKDLTTGGIEKGVLDFNRSSGSFFIKDTKNLDDFGKSIGFKEGDILKKWDGKDLNIESINEVLGGFFGGMIEGLPFTIDVERDGKPVQLKGTVTKSNVMKDYVLELTPNPTPAQLELRKQWLGDKTVMEIKK